MNGWNGWTGIGRAAFLPPPMSASGDVADAGQLVRPASARPRRARRRAPRRPTATRIVRHGQAARRAARPSRRFRRRSPGAKLRAPADTAGGAAASRSVPPTRCAVVWPRTSARMPALSMRGTPLRSTTRCRWPPRKSCRSWLSNASAAPPADERLHRRHDEPIAGRSSRHMGSGAGLYTNGRGPP